MFTDFDGEPTAAELAAIEAEWPLIAAELDVVDAEIALLYAADRGGPSSLDWRRVRRAEARVTRVAVELAARPVRTATEPAGNAARWPLTAAGMTAKAA